MRHGLTRDLADASETRADRDRPIPQPERRELSPRRIARLHGEDPAVPIRIADRERAALAEAQQRRRLREGTHEGGADVIEGGALRDRIQIDPDGMRRYFESAVAREPESLAADASLRLTQAIERGPFPLLGGALPDLDQRTDRDVECAAGRAPDADRLDEHRFELGPDLDPRRTRRRLGEQAIHARELGGCVVARVDRLEPRELDLRPGEPALRGGDLALAQAEIRLEEGPHREPAVGQLDAGVRVDLFARVARTASGEPGGETEDDEHRACRDRPRRRAPGQSHASSSSPSSPAPV